MLESEIEMQQQGKSHKRLQRGFTLLELVIVMFIISVLSAIVVSMGSAASDWQKARESRTKLEETADAWRKWADFNTPAYLASWGSTATVTIAAADAKTTLVASGVASDARAQQLVTDGYNRAVRIVAGPVQTLAMERGLSAKFRDFYVVSAGENGAFDFVLSASGAVTATGDDVFVLVTGFDSSAKWTRDVLAKADKLEAALRSYYQGRYLSDPARDAFVTYFYHQGGNATTDPATNNVISLASSATTGALYSLNPNDMTSGTWATLLGLADADIRGLDGSFPFSLQLDGGPRVPSTSTPPFTAWIHANVPATQGAGTTLRYTASVQSPI